jgi:uncharacterized protein YjbI with pentapeptide repeats
MANPEHVEIVKQGVLAIRRWRDANPNEWLDLREADLAGVEIEPTDIPGLSKTKLGWADLQGANLREADLRGIDLEEATDLRGATLDKANLRGVKLVKAKLSKARLVGADLADVDLTEADLDEADVSKAHLFRTILGGAFLAKLIGAHRAYGLETVRFLPKADALVPTHDGRYFEHCVRKHGQNLLGHRHFW